MEINARAALAEARLYGILDLGYVSAERAVTSAARMLEGGVQVLQLRAKLQPMETIAELATSLAPLCRQAGVPFILNDYPQLVPVTGADGVHIGQDDLPVEEARRLAGPDAIVGKSSHSLDQARRTSAEAVDYLGFGPLFATPTKPDYTPIGLADIVQAYREVRQPIFCIGGIKLENLPAVQARGAQRVVIVSGILQAADIAGYCRACRELLDAAPLG